MQHSVQGPNLILVHTTAKMVAYKMEPYMEEESNILELQ